MMNRLEHLLFILAEEGAEVAQRASKAARFGIDEVQEGQPLTNEERIWYEFSDLIAVSEMIQTERGKGGICRQMVQAKKEKVERFLEYSRKMGTLED